jgi:hypothetical protein
MGPRYRRRPPAPLALSPRPGPRRCPLVHPVPAIVVPRPRGPHPHLLVAVVWSSSFVPPPRLVLVAVWSSSLSFPHPCPCFIVVPVPGPVVVVLSWSWLSCRRRSTLQAGARSGVWRVLGQLRRQQF